MGFEKIFDILNWAKDKLPIPDRLEAIKNEILKLEKERKDLLQGEANAKKSKRVIWINDRIELLNKRLQNASNSA
jgi:hypothetical protein